MATSAPTDNRVYLYRLLTLNIDYGTAIVRNLIDDKCSNTTLPAVLGQERRTIRNLVANRTITKVQFDLLNPPSGSPPTTADFDLTLATCLLRSLKFFGLNSKYTWNVPPQAGDTSPEADVCRLRIYRHELAHISSTTGISETDFKTKWADIEMALHRLNSLVLHPIQNLQHILDDCKNGPLDPEAEKEIEKEIEAMQKIEEKLEIKVRNIKKEISEVKKDAHDTKDEVSEVRRQVQNTTKDVNEMKHEVTEMKGYAQKVKKEVQEVKGDVHKVKKEVQEVKGYVHTVKKEVHKLSEATQKIMDELEKQRISEDTRHDLQTAEDAYIRQKEPSTLWTVCISSKDKDAASELINTMVLPSNEELLMAFDVFGRSSETFLALCKMITKIIESKSQGSYVWPSYHCNKKQVVFVVETNDKSMEIKVADYHIYIRCIMESSGECALVMSQMSCKNITEEEQKELEKLRKSIIKNANNLMDSHSKLSVAIPSLKKSVGYQSLENHVFDEPCITLYVTVKGLIPIEEYPFPKLIDDFKVDVIEGKFFPYGGFANDFHEQLKMGLAIHGSAINKNGEILGGTLGGFVDHPVHGLCGISSAHVLLTGVELLSQQTSRNVQVFQPVGNESKPFGEIVSVICVAGDATSPGMEVVLFKIHRRHPVDGSFPETFNYIDAGFDENDPPMYNSGKVLKATEIKRRPELYKFGMATTLSRGAFGCRGAAVRLERMDGQSYGLGFSLVDQIVVLPIGNKPFADFGDSGALVLTRDEHNDSYAVGLVVGGLAGSVFVTPIHDILRALECKNEMYQFNTSPFVISHPDSGTDEPDLMETNAL